MTRKQSTSELKRTRRKIDDALKTKVVLESLKDIEPLSVLASRYEVIQRRTVSFKAFLRNRYYIETKGCTHAATIHSTSSQIRIDTGNS